MIRIVDGKSKELLFCGELKTEQLDSLIEHAKALERLNGGNEYAEVIRMVCNRYDLKESEIYGKTRLHEYVKGRAIIYKRLRDEYGYTLQRIAAIFSKSHVSIMHQLNMMKTQKSYIMGYKTLFGE